MQGQQTEMDHVGSRRVMAMGSAYDVVAANRDRDVVVNASYSGVLPARFIAEHRPHASIGVDCGVGPAGAAIAGLWYLEALGIPAAAADVSTVLLGNGVDLYEAGVLSYVNQPAAYCGVTPGMTVKQASSLLLRTDPAAQPAQEIQHRTVVVDEAEYGQIVCLDSIAFAQPQDRGQAVLVTAGHTGITAVPYLLEAFPRGFVCSDGGGGRDGSGTAALDIVAAEGLAGATVDARTARMGDGLSTWQDGVISARNDPAARCGVEVGMTCKAAARRLLLGHV